jgi:hypothetical protein
MRFVVALLLMSVVAHADDAAVDYIADARLYYRVVACKGSDALPANLDAPTIEKHCEEMAKRYERFAEKYVTPAQAFFAPLLPKDLPTTVVYPFGGGDLASALVTYPAAREITTISLEHAGDPTRLGRLQKKSQLSNALVNYRAAIFGLLTLNDSTSENMRKLERGGIPGQLSFHLTGMAAMGYEPVSLKFFTLNDDGTIHYLTKPEYEALEKKIAKKKNHSWVDTDFSEAFTNMELSFRKAGDASAPVIVHRHIAWNLGDKLFKGSALEKHLVAKGKVAAMTKAASYLIWNSGFSGIRDYLLQNMVWMASDATGIPPRWAKKAGFEIVTYGTFKGPFLEEADPTVGDEMVKLWEKQPRRKLPFRYGYPDSEKNLHLMITKPVEKK